MWPEGPERPQTHRDGAGGARAARLKTTGTGREGRGAAASGEWGGVSVSAVTPVLRKALWKELGAGIQDPEATVKLQILSKLLPPPGSKGLHNLMDCLPAAPERAGNEESWAVADAISTVLKNSEELHSWRRHLFSACIKGLVAMYSSSKDEGKQEVERSMLLRLEELLCVVEEVDPDDWCDLVKTGLKYRYRDETFLKVLNVAIQLLYMKESSLRA
nr:nucleolar pre-ribosomal-associated protein 1-like [Taeniopygia guttata]XP_041569773.1 nucleolar pre-ribosomal-associated protein 1-like [Taeniopygia guttata]